MDGGKTGWPAGLLQDDCKNLSAWFSNRLGARQQLKEQMMAERNYDVRTVGVDYLCDKCGDGVMDQTGIMLPGDPPRWRHKCNRCGEIADLWQNYPTVRFERQPAF